MNTNDLISRQAAIDAIEKLILPQVKGETAAEEINRVAWRCAINCAEEMIGHLPSAERRGRWIETGMLYRDTRGINSLFYGKRCSVCNEISDYKPHYCPNCGARMEAGE